MRHYGRYALVALIVVALLSVGAHEAVSRTVDQYDVTNCGSAMLTVTQFDSEHEPEATVVYGNLSADLRAAFDRARAGDGATVIDPGTLAESPLVREVDDMTLARPTIVRADRTPYNVIVQTANCPVIAGTPPVTNVLVRPLLAIYRVFSPLYLPVAGLIGAVVAYRRIDARLRFD